MNRKRVLFLCQRHDARSPMAEAFLKNLGTQDFFVDSAGIEPAQVDPLAVEVMREKGLDISGRIARSVFDLFQRGKHYHYIITLSRMPLDGRCPMFPGVTHRMHMPFDDPREERGSMEDRLSRMRLVRDGIHCGVREFAAWVARQEPAVADAPADCAVRPLPHGA